MLFNKSIPVQTIKERSKQKAQELFPKPLAIIAPENTVPSQKPKAKPLSKTVLSFLRIWLNLPHPFYLLSTLLAKAEITSGSVRNKILKTLTRYQLVIVHTLQIGRQRHQIWEPTLKAYETLDLSKPSYPSKGGFMHQFCAQQIESAAMKKSYKVTKEFMLPNNKAVDLALSKGNTLIFVEIAISPPMKKELKNIVADLATQTRPNQLIMVTLNKKAKREIEGLVKADPRANVYANRIKFMLVGDFINKNPEV